MSQLHGLDKTLESAHNEHKESQSSPLKRSLSEEAGGCGTPDTIVAKDTDYTCDSTLSVQTCYTPSRTSSSHIMALSPVTVKRQIDNPKRDCGTQQVVEKTKKQNVDVTVKVEWPSKDREQKLPDDLEPLGKMLVRGTYKQIANAVWKKSLHSERAKCADDEIY